MVFIGTRDLLLPDARLLGPRQRHHVPTETLVHDGMYHNGHGRSLTEARDATLELALFITTHTHSTRPLKLAIGRGCADCGAACLSSGDRGTRSKGRSHWPISRDRPSRMRALS
ncbi:hypothetical protein DFR67_1428 [Williamsia limnetica]|uniref:Uncharacterized protein n=1 Tax=Williamsia limnetica TaxID=882452 RepID=A0A318RAM2_WILLI|nr:hypothetical protein DFR67_1428 [Williamsia limnetica]